jgi:hypothetical protein
MAFNGSFAVSQGADISQFTLTDNSTGTDAGLTGRRIYLLTTDGTTLVPEGNTLEYIDWPLVATIGDTITIDVLEKDYAITIFVTWVSSAPLASPSSYEYTYMQLFSGYTNQFLYGLIQKMAANPLLSSDKNFYYNLSKVYTDLDNATLAVANSDQYSAQMALDRIELMISNEANLF